MKDFELIEAFQSGDEFAFVGIYNRYKGPVYAFCLKMLNDAEQAQDCMQDTYLRVYENRDRLLNSSAFKSWLFTIARNQCLNRIRRNKRHIGFSDEIERRISVADTPMSRMEKNEQIRFVGTYIDRLKPEYREVLILREYQNLTYEEIAAVTRTTVSSVKSRLFKARKKFALLLTKVAELEQPDTESKPPQSPVVPVEEVRKML